MSTYYGLRKSIKADELFDGRLEAFGVREEVKPEGTADQYPPYLKVKEVRYLTDGRNSMKVAVYENGVACIDVRNLWCAPEREILHAIAEAFDTDIVSEHELSIGVLIRKTNGTNGASRGRGRMRTGSTPSC
jgi:hypothetical protein